MFGWLFNIERKGDSGQRLGLTFDLLDVDEDGFIGKQEMTDVLKEVIAAVCLRCCCSFLTLEEMFKGSCLVWTAGRLFRASVFVCRRVCGLLFRRV